MTRLISPDGRRLAFSVAAESGGQRSSLVVSDLDGANRHVVDTIPQQVWQVYWFGNDQILSSWIEATGYRVSAINGTKPPEWKLPKGSDMVYMRPSADGRRIAFVGNYTVAADERQYGLFVVDREKGTIRRLLDTAVKTAPAWSPDSTRLAIGNAAGYVCNYPLVLIDVESGEVTDTGVKGVGAAWSPDGRYLAFCTDTVQGGSWFQGVPIDSRIGVLDLESKTLTPVSPPAWNRNDQETKRWEVGGALNPVWSPDSRWIAYQHGESTSVEGRDKKSVKETWVVDREGKEARKALDSAPEVAWTPDSRTLIFIEGGRPERVDVFSLPAVAGPAVAPAPAAFSAAPAVAVATPAQPAFDPTPLFNANRLWQNPPLDKPESVSFTHSMKPKRLDERFVWRRDGASLLEVVGREDDSADKEIGRRWVTTSEPARYYLASKGRLAKKEDADSAAIAEYFRDHLMGTRANCVAIDWGRNPDSFVIRAAEGVGGKGNVTLRLVPRDSRFSLNAGAMFQTTSWGYVHDKRIQKSELTVDPATWRILKEVDYSEEGKKECEIEFSDWIDAVGGQSVPGRIHFYFPEHKFDVDYRFQWRPEGLWILASGDATFKGQEQQRETIVDLTVNGPTPELDQALALVRETQDYIGGSSQSSPIEVAPFEFALGKKIPLRRLAETSDSQPARSLLFTLAPDGELLAELDFPSEDVTDTSATAVLILLDESAENPVAAGRADFCDAGSEATAKSQVHLGHARTLAKSRFCALALRRSGATTFDAYASGPRAQPRRLAAFPFVLDKPIPLDLHDEGDDKTRLKRATFTENPSGDVLASLEFVSEDAWKIFRVEASAVLLSQEAIPLAAATTTLDFKVENELAQSRAELNLGNIPARQEAAWIVFGVRRGEDRGLYHGHSVWMTRVSDDTWIFPIADLLAADDPRVWRQGLRDLDNHIRNRDMENELFRDLHHRSQVEKNNGLRSQRLAPYLDRLLQLVDQTDSPDDVALICRLLGHSGDMKFRPVLGTRLDNPDDRVKDAAAIGLGLLGDPAGQSRLGPILLRPLPEGDYSVQKPVLELQSDAGLALATIGSDSAIDTLGEGLLAAIDGIVATPGPRGGESIGGTYSTANRLIAVLGNTQNPKAIAWLRKALKRGDNSERVKYEVQRTLEKFDDPEAVRQVYIDAIGRGDGFYLSQAPRDPALLPDIESMLQKKELKEYAVTSAADFLKDLKNPKALELLRTAHARTWPDDFSEARVQLADALASYGDPSGLPDAFLVLVRISDPSTLPDDQAKRHYEESNRKRRLEGIQSLFKSDSLKEADIVEFLGPRLESPDEPTRRAALDIAGFLDRIPDALAPAVEKARTLAPSPTPG